MNENHSTADEKIAPFEDFAINFENLKGAESKLRAALDYMHTTLNKKKPPYFKGFWEARKLCFPLFKEQLEAPLRAELWNLYTELTREGRELKGMLDQETSFAVEQIDLAISGLEKQLSDPKEGIQAVVFPEKLKSLNHNKRLYLDGQAELNRLNLFASRINGLRKELSHTEMRVRHKNKFFQRLSKLGDSIFPRRKDLISQISTAFESDVARFVEENFSEKSFCPDKIKRSLFFFREEIKALQACAKLLTINTHAFTITRASLSSCWDQLRGMEKELKKDFAKQKVKSSENVEMIRAQLADFEQKRASLTMEAATKELDNILHKMREIELTRTDVQLLKDEVQKAREPLNQQKEKVLNAAKESQATAEKAKREKVLSFKARLEKLHSADLETVEREIEECRKEMATFSKIERLDCEPLLRSLRDKLAEKKEGVLLSLPDDTKASISLLQKLLDERLQQRREIKEQLESYRKLIGGSALSFEKAIEMGELVEQERERLFKCDRAIEEVEQKIEQLIPKQ